MNDFDDNFEPPKPLIGGGSHKLKWDQASFNLNSQGKGFVLITIIGVSGSTPRNSGTKMVVSQNQSFDTKPQNLNYRCKYVAVWIVQHQLHS